MYCSIRLASLTILLGLLAASPGQEQPAGKRPSFEVATIKLNKGCDPRAGNSSNSRNSVSLVCRTLRQYIEFAYTVWDGARPRWPRPEVLGGPRWLDTDLYDITAKAEGVTPYWQMTGPMLQTLLEERLQLRMHNEPKEASVFEMTLVKEGPGLKRTAEGSCRPPDFENPQSQPRPPGPPAFAPGQRPCNSGTFRFQGSDIFADWYGLTMSEFAGYAIPARVGRPVVDKTGLAGLYRHSPRICAGASRFGAGRDRAGAGHQAVHHPGNRTATWVQAHARTGAATRVCHR